ncbi:Cell division protein FtsQ [Borrelia miyamotoi]|uniref:FtsQ-type POTRA domain-containing protein n=1 Tax=Borrelia miyamotoi TaxID=47466 RepID=A0AAP8YRW3_9SPIR|nr:FtsQ-type POTRA domain-containing protein [Borrelia miyamotoi]AHH05113.1 Cell division protein ftsQ [Borrelia miyamotoi FR64b]ATQ14903.1 FtsQ-type POTRA domain-containing protein [Borrelia miyamotoi]ATQ16086.1 FtsQ-type POTRA domain-containing protein [Borrelia miyamotoi]ATQ17231.1 FtsQ-type POTRA domain-containing protein [Borrelia miyamotoi]ATQ18263.1 FtsQ-type POTRA domain-containing protein [Borrelia miyamotoi]
MLIYRKFLLIYTYIIISAILFEIIFIIFISPYFLIRYISFNDDIHISKEDILSISGIKPNTYYYDADVDTYKKNIMRDLRVKNAKVQLKFPNTISINIERRVPIVTAYDNVDGNFIYYFISSDGVILEKSKDLIYDLPIISGLNLNSIEAGDFLEDGMLAIVKNLNYVKINQITLYNLISEISFLKLNFYDYRIILYIKNIYNKILITSDMNLISVMYKVFMISDLLRGRSDTIDLRSGDIILLGED